MQKIKILAALLIVNCLLLIGAKPAMASILAIQTLPSYINNNNFKLSCTTDGNSAQFYYSKNGGGFSAFGPVIDLTTSQCLVQVDGNTVNDQTTYVFKVNVDGVDSSTTSTIYDNSGPGNVSGYYKENLGNGFKIHWTNPSDSDFSRVVIYRGETPDFSADSSHEITTQPGGAGSPMTFDDIFAVDPAKTYYYDLRAIDYAGNSSGLVGDATTSTNTTTSTGTPKATTGKVTVLPVQQGSGSVLGTEATASPQATATFAPQTAPTTGVGGVWTWIMGHKKISLGAALILIVIGYLLFRRKNS